MMSEEICAKLLPVPRTYVSVKLKTVKTPLYEKRPPTTVFFHVIFFCSYICSLPVHFLATTIQDNSIFFKIQNQCIRYTIPTL